MFGEEAPIIQVSTIKDGITQFGGSRIERTFCGSRVLFGGEGKRLGRGDIIRGKNRLGNGVIW